MNLQVSVVQVLDADKGERLESSTGRVATRDIVQFVPMRDVHSTYFHSEFFVLPYLVTFPVYDVPVKNIFIVAHFVPPWNVCKAFAHFA